jgi:hypothetical protein
MAVAGVVGALGGALALAGPALAGPITFTEGPNSPHGVGVQPRFIAAADVDGDDNADQVVANFLNSHFSILLGDGTGDFAPAPTSPEPHGGLVRSLDFGDFNDDDQPDFAAPDSSGNLMIHMNQGGGDFAQPATSPEVVDADPTAVNTAAAAADFNVDGDQDLAVSTGATNEVTIMTGDGTGDFTVGQSFPVPAQPSDVIAGDFGGSSAPDLAVGASGGTGTTILIGDGNGGFTQPATSPEPSGSGAQKLAPADLDDDGDLDIAVANLNVGDQVLLNQGGGDFVNTGLATGGSSSIGTGDFDDDGHLDLVLGLTSGGSRVWAGDGNGGFSFAPTSVVAGGPGFTDLAVADFDNDTRPDLGLTATNNNQVHTFLNRTVFKRTLTVTTAGGGAGAVASTPAGIGCPGDCTERYDEGTAVTLTATPAADSEFAGWSGGGCSGAASTCQVTLGTGPLNVQASFDVSRDKAAPETTITKEPRNPRPKRTRFSFASEPGATFACTLDGGAPEACTSRWTYRGLKRGRHTFSVAATDAAGNTDPTPAISNFKVKRKRGHP